MENSSPFLSVVIPCFNEEKNLKNEVLTPVVKFLNLKSFTYEVIVVDDGSTDQSLSVLNAFIKNNPHWKIIRNHHGGKGNAVITGMLAAKGKIILFTDLDQATPISEVDKLLPLFKQGFAVVIGSRNSRREGAPIFRLLMARGFMMLRTLILGLSKIHDTQCGFKAFKREVARDIFRRLKLYGDKHNKVTGSQVSAGFDVESLFLAKKLGYKIKEVPVNWHYVETRRINPITDSWQGLIDIIKIRLNNLKHEYDEG
jgi:glycosyltransferase involved in cell wall biosynthesis